MKSMHLALAVAAILPTLELNAAAHTYYLGESSEYSGHGCVYNPSLAKLPYDLNALAYSLTAAGWTGYYFAKDSDLPQFFVDWCKQSDGFDVMADSQDLVVEIHHGNIGHFSFGYPSSNGRCSVNLKDDMRLGSMIGATASTAVFGSCCTLNRNYIASTANWQWTRQNIGFHDLASFDNGMFADWFEATEYNSWISNKEAWFTHFEDRPWWFTGDNSPIVISYGTSASDAQNTHNTARLGGGVLVSPRGGGPACGATTQPLFYYRFEYIDHGNGGCWI